MALIFPELQPRYQQLLRNLDYYARTKKRLTAQLRAEAGTSAREQSSPPLHRTGSNGSSVSDLADLGNSSDSQ